ncbi:hypothetical protein DPMN_031201 [Dreissena polymorpha]|uniref:Uncharacterized protein n=1 Tax=Dreissena polymorpha TaxID=45954 RepID=A0A9D4RJ29_DREPO|nr:hypothetical protein DPMN_031201 [Dreissena polymorpha]
MSAVGSTGRDKRRTIQKLSQSTERSSNWLWLRRDDTALKKLIYRHSPEATVAPPSRDVQGSGAKHLRRRDTMLMMIVDLQYTTTKEPMSTGDSWVGGILYSTKKTSSHTRNV